MRINVINMLRQAARAIDPERDTGAYKFMLDELRQNLAMVRDGEHSWDEFAQAYCLTEADRPRATEAHSREEG